MFRRIATAVLIMSASLLSIGVSLASADTSAACTTNPTMFPDNVNPTTVGAIPALSGATRVKASIETVTYNRCNGSDPDAKDGVFTYVGLQRTYESGPLFYDGGTASKYGSYVRLGTYLCLWSGDTACGQGHGYFISYSRKAGVESCSTSSATGIHRLGATAAGSHTFELVVQADGSVKAYISGSLVYTVPAAEVGCWSTATDIDAYATGAVWDPGDAVGGSSSSPQDVQNIMVNAVSGSHDCFGGGAAGPFRCGDTGTDDISFWTIDR